VGLCVAVELAQREPGLGARRAPLRIHPYAPHLREVDHQAAVAHAVTGDVVPAAAHRYRELVLPSKAHAAHDVVGIGAPRDQGWALVDQPVPDHAGIFVCEIVRPHKLTAQTVLERGDGRLVKFRAHLGIVRVCRGWVCHVPSLRLAVEPVMRLLVAVVVLARSTTSPVRATRSAPIKDRSAHRYITGTSQN